MTDEALDQYAKSVLLDALRLEWDDTGQEGAFAPSKRHQNEMRELVADPEAWYQKRTAPPWRRYARRLTAIAAMIAVCVLAVWFLPEGGGAAARSPGALGGIWVVLLAIVSWVIYKKVKNNNRR